MTEQVLSGPAALGTGERGAAISELLHGALLDLRQLAREYLALTNIKLRDGARLAKRGMVALAVAAVLGIVGIGQLTYGIVGLIAARSEIIREQVQITTVTAAINLVIAGILAYVAVRLFGKALETPKSIVATPHKEDSPWQKTV